MRRNSPESIIADLLLLLGIGFFLSQLSYIYPIYSFLYLSLIILYISFIANPPQWADPYKTATILVWISFPLPFMDSFYPAYSSLAVPAALVIQGLIFLVQQVEAFLPKPVPSWVEQAAVELIISLYIFLAAHEWIIGAYFFFDYHTDPDGLLEYSITLLIFVLVLLLFFYSFEDEHVQIVFISFFYTWLLIYLTLSTIVWLVFFFIYINPMYIVAILYSIYMAFIYHWLQGLGPRGGQW